MDEPAMEGAEGRDPLAPVEPVEPPLELELPALPAAAPEREPFWGYMDLGIFVGLAVPCMLVGFSVVKLAMWLLNLHPAVATWELLAEQFAGYGVLFGALAVMFRVQYNRPFWRSLGWVTPGLSFHTIVACGVALALGLGLLGTLIHIPQIDNPLTKLLKNPTSLILIAIFGSIIAPVCEELLFRGFLQPLLVRSLGALAGILATALPFGLLHYQEYGNSWRHVLLITLSGVAFGWMRQSTGSTKAAAGLHAAFNGFQFIALIASGGVPR
ncbi:MAG: type II CAAX endopeptidase family protein [Candidatus Solibacter sp.]